MKAAFFERRGPAREVLQVGERPLPEPGPGEVRVKVAVSAVNPSDIKGRSQWLGASQMAFPLVIPHQDGAGTIDRVGVGVSPERIGERVWLYMAQRGRPFGTAAEFTVVPAQRAVPLAGNASFADGACLGIPAMTAHFAVFDASSIAGKTVLVQGGAGAVGFYAVQWAKWGGARQVIATVSREQQAERARAAGADAIVNYKQPDVVDRIRAAAGGEASVDRIIEVNFGANVATDIAVLARNGIIASYGSDSEAQPRIPYSAFTQKDVTLRVLIIYEAPQAARDAAARDIDRLLGDGALKHQIAARFPLDRIVEAHEALESGHSIGKVLIDID
jgi:NADPH2:quinone reductase